MLGYVYNNPKLAYEGDGFYCYDGKTPHEYWCIILEKEDEVLLAPIFFDLMDNLSNEVLDTCPIQIDNYTLGIGQTVLRSKKELTTEPIIYFNPQKAKEAYNKLARSLRDR